MTIQELLSSDIVRLPKDRPSNGTFRQYYNELLNEYYQKAKSIEFPPEIDSVELLGRLEVLIKKLKSVIRKYYDGSPSDAYRRLRDAIVKSKITEYWDDHKIIDIENFYRLRVVDDAKHENYPLEKKELFHIPFELRGLVSTQRYSIPGFPSLYLSNSVYVAWEEMRRPKLDRIQAARFQNKYQLSFVNLTTQRYLGNYNADRKQMIADFMMWPLIASCSIKVKNPTNHFKPEYIVPQLLLQWIRNHKDVFNVQGIKFSSTHIDLNEKKKTIGNFYNLVIPVSDNKENGYCDRLSEGFKMSDVLSWQLHQFSLGAPGVRISYNINKEINKDIQRVELVKDRGLPYDFSPLSTLEHHLNDLKLDDINFNNK